MKKTLRSIRFWGLVLGSALLAPSDFAQQDTGGNPMAWSQADIGPAKQAGSFTQTGSTLTLTGGGGDIWGTADTFHFAYVPWNGDGWFIARVDALDKTHPWAKAGVMIRADLGEGAIHATVAVAPDKGVTFLRRLGTGGPTQDDASQAMRVMNTSGALMFQRRSSSFYDAATDGPTWAPLPRWVALARGGDVIQAFDSGDGTNWEWVGTESIHLPQAVFVGLAVSSHDMSRLAAARFGAVQFLRQSPTAAPTPVIGHGDGLQGNYYPSPDLSGTPVQRVDPGVNFIWDGQPPMAGVGPEDFSVRWEGDLQAQFSEFYALHVVSDDRARLWINGRLVIDEWENHPETESTAYVPLEAGKTYSLRLEYFQGRGQAVAKLLWSSVSTPKQPIPQTQLYSAPQDRDGDGIPDSWETANGLNPRDPKDADAQARADGTTWRQLFVLGIEPWKAAAPSLGLPAGWTDSDIGFVGQPGGVKAQGGSPVVSGAGADVWGRADGFHFLYQTLTGDGQIVAKVGAVDETDPWAKAGLMVRADLEDGSVNAFIARTPGHGATFQYRSAKGGGTVAEFGGPTGELCWLKLQRHGNVVSAYQSDDRLNWQWVGTVSLPLSPSVHVGPAVTSHDNSRLAAASFDEISLGRVPALAPPAAGRGDGLLATYRDAATGITVVRVDPELSFDWGLGSPTKAIGADDFTATWEGVLEAQFDEPYTFHLISDDGSRLWLDGQKIIDAWSDHGAQEATAKVRLQAGRHYLIRVEYYERVGEAVAQLLWSSPSTPKQPIPQSQLYSARNAAYASALQDATTLAQSSQIAVVSPRADAGDTVAGVAGRETNSLPAEITNAVTVAEVQGAAYVASSGIWSISGPAVRAQEERGYVEFSLVAPKDDMYQLEVEAGAWRTRGKECLLPLRLSIDGEFLGRFTLAVDGGKPNPGSLRQLTPWVKAGPHLVRIFWDNAQKRAPVLEVQAVRLQQVDGLDFNGNGISDWMEARLQADCGIEVAPMTSFVSPVCLEGRGGFLGMMQMCGDVRPQPGAGKRWYSNVPLSATEPTPITVSFQNGGRQESRLVEWTPTDILHSDDLTIREGDALLLGVGASSLQGSVAILGLTNYSLGPGQSVAHQFTAAGTYTVAGAGTGPDGLLSNRSINVTVVGATLGDAPIAWAGKSRRWACPDLPAGAVLEHDPRVELIGVTNPSAAASGYALKTDAQEPRYILARLGAKGPVLANLRVDGFRLFALTDAYVERVESFPDDSMLIESGLVLSPLLPQARVRLEIVVGGVTFDDGTILKDLTAADFDELGRAAVRFIRPADVQTSICHLIKVYQNDVLVGEY